MGYDFGTLKDHVLGYCGQSTGGTYEDLAAVGINMVYRQILDLGNIPLEERVFTLTTVASTHSYGLPLYIRRVLNIEDPDNERFLWESSIRGFDQANPGTTDSGTPERCYPVGARGTRKMPATSGTLTLLSSSSADSGTNYKVRVTGFNTSSQLVTELVTMAGTTPVATTNSFSSTLGVERVVKVPASGLLFTGDVTVRDYSGNEIAQIPTWWTSPDFNWVRFHPIPDAALTYNIRAEMRKPPLVNDSDWPEFDQEFHDLLIWGTTKDLLPALGQRSTADAHRRTFELRLEQYTGVKAYHPSTILVFGDVQSGALGGQLGRPLFKGIDIGLAS